MNRYFFVVAGAFLIGLVILFRLFHLSFVEGDYWKRVSQKFIRQNLEIPAQRGNILAADGQVLATSLPEYRLYMDFMAHDKDSLVQHRAQVWRDSIICADTLRVIPGLLNRAKKPIPESTQRQHIDSCRRTLTALCQGMHRIFPEIDPAAFRQHLIEGRAKRSQHWPLYRRKVSYIQYQQVRKLPFFSQSTLRTGFHTQEYRTRQNPYGKLAARTVGDLYGEKDSARCGLELSFDSLLRGRPGSCHRQKVLNRYVSIFDRMPEDGYDIRTTLDIGLQDIVEKALGEQLASIGADFGICAVMEVSTGDIKAISSLDRLSDGSYREIGNRAISLLMEPGSVFKTVSFMVGLDEGAFTLDTRIDTYGGVYEMYRRKMKDSNWRKGGHGNMSASEVLEHSSNIGTSRLIDQFYHDQPERYVKAVYRTGIHDDLQLPLVGYAKPRIRMPRKDKTGRYWENWSNTALPWMSIGYETQVPPISTLTFYNGIANGGTMLYPRFVKSVERGGEVIREYPVRVARQHMCKPSTIRDLHKALRNTVVRGTGKPCGSKRFAVSGKTGTAQIWTNQGNTNRYLVSFVGYFPSERPKYSMIVCIKKASPAYGGMHCGPVFKRVAESIMAQQREKSYKTAADTLHARHAVIRPGNLRATRQVMSNLNMNASAGSADGETEGSQWGSAAHSGNSYDLTAEKEQKGLMPDLTGYGLRDAVYRLERMGLRVHTRGVGRVVKQNLKPGSPVRPGAAVSLELSADGKDLPDEPKQPEQPSAPPQKEEAPAPKEADTAGASGTAAR
ncbi:MAG: transpeptidase family protein [Bacteroidaceae bacterium]|nr:transpeptidase family protein [Bacteroidaceae bacterium]